MTRATFFKHFELLADQQDAVDQLRALIRRLAVRGEILPQVDTAASADKLLAEILRRKTRHQNKGAVLPDKYQASVESGEQPHSIPSSWCWTRIGAVVLSNLGGGTPSKNIAQYWDGDIPWASVKDVGHAK